MKLNSILTKVESEISYFLSSCPDSPTILGKAIRSHQAVENRAHYVRKVILNEGASRVRTRPGMMARIHSVALNVLRANGVRNASLASYANAVSFDHLLALSKA